jgi:diadenosine tetraphosphate (Ap4A) HIT family hydrolase
MKSRFDWVTHGLPRGQNPRCDVPVASIPEGVAIPSVGALVPGWLLVIPRQAALSYANMDQGTRNRLYQLARDLAHEVSDLGCPVILEHGAAVSNSSVGCGVDQAHLHVVPVRFDLLGRVLADPWVAWSETSVENPWDSVPFGREYYLIIAGNEAFVGAPIVSQSQFFRRHIANGVDLSEQWDYKGWPHYGNVERTIRKFGLAAVT